MAHPLRWLRRLFSRDMQNGPARPPARPRSWDRYLLQLERLEDRLAPATIITIINTGVGSLDGLLAYQAGLINATDGAIGGGQAETISAAALAALPATDNISINAQTSILFDDLGGTLTLATSTNQFAIFTANGGAITFANTANTLATSGGALEFDAATDVTLANLNTAGGNVFLFAESGALNTQNIATGASGDGAAIVAQAQNSVVAGTLSADAIELVSFNSTVSTSASGLLQGGTLSLEASTGINVQTSVTYVTAVNQVSGDIDITQAASPATPLNIDIGGITNGANATLASSGGAISVVNLGSSIALAAAVSGGESYDPGGPVQSNNGTIELLAADLMIDNTINSGTARTVLGNAVAGTTIDLGTDTAGSIGLTQAEVSEVTASVLQIGTATAGDINVSQPVAALSTWNTLHLISGGVISQVATAPLTVTNLAAEGAAGVNLNIDPSINPLGNTVANLAGDVTTAGAGFTFFDDANLTVGTVDGVVGVATQGFSKVGSNPIGDNLTVNSAVQNTGASATFILLYADSMSLNAPVNGSSALVELTAPVHLRAITVGTTVANTLSLLQSDLDQVTAGVLQIGSSQATGGLTVTAAIVAPAGWNTLDLEQSGTASLISEDSATGSLAVTNLSVRGGGGITLDCPNNSVRNLAFNNTSGAVSFVDSGSLTIAVVDGLSSSSNTGTTTDLTAASPITFAVDTTSAGTLAATTHNALPLLDGSITVDGGATVESTGGDVTGNAAGSVSVQASGIVKSDGGSVTLTAGADSDDAAATLTVDGAIVGGQNITLSAPSDVDLGGTLSAVGTVSITSANGAIVDTNPVTELITATNLAVSAANGVGSIAAPIATAVGNLVAYTTTGDMDIDNTGNLNIGYAGAPQLFTAGTGLVHFQGAGDIVLNNAGSIDIANLDGAVVTDVYNADGSITINANGAASDLIAGGNGLIYNPDIVNATITLHAGRNLVLGTAGASSYVQSPGDIVLSAGGNIVVDEGTAIRAGNTPSGFATIQATAGGNVSLLATTNSGANFSTEAGAITLTTGAGGVFTNNSGAGGGVDSAAGSGSGAITINADDMFINDPIDAGTANVVLQTVTAGRAIDLGTTVQPPASGPAGPTLGLSNAELQQINAAVLQIGNATAGDINVTQAIAPLGVSTLHLISAGTINQALAGTIAVTNLALEGAAGVNVTPTYAIGNNVTNLAGDATAPLSSFFFINNSNLTVDTVDGVVGINAPQQVYLGVQGVGNKLTVSSPVAGTNILFYGDTMALKATVDATDTVVLTPPVQTWAITLGTTVANTLSLLQSDLNEVTAAVLQIGSSTATGGINITAPVTAATGWNTVDLEQSGSSSPITEAAGASLTVTNLSVHSFNGGGAILNGNNAITGQLAADSAGAGQFSFSNAGNLTVGTVDGVVGITTNGGLIGLLLNGLNNLLTLSQPIDSTDAGATPAGANITLTADNMAIGAAVNAGTSVATLTPFTGGQLINLGGADAAGTLGLTSAELHQITAGVVRVGNAGAGNISVSSNITAPATWSTLSLITAGGVAESAATTLDVPSLAVTAGKAVALAGANTVSTVAGTIATAGQAFSFLSAGSLIVGTVDGVAGISTTNGAITVTADPSISLTISNNVTAGNAPVSLSAAGLDSALANNAVISGNSAQLIADSMVLQGGTINVGSGSATLLPFSANAPTSLDNTAGDPAGELRLSNTELSSITAGILRVGAQATVAVPLTAFNAGPAGAITLKSPITPAHVGTLSLQTAAGLTQTSGIVTVPNLDVVAGTGVGTPAAPLMTTVGAFAAKVGSGGIYVSNFSPTLTIGSVDGVTGIGATGAGTVDIETVGNLSLNDNVTTGAAPITLAAHGVGNLFTSAAAVSNTGGNTITLIGDSVALGSSTTSAVGGGRIIVQPDTPNRAINLGTSTDTVFELSNSELNTLQTTGVAQIGGPTAGALSILGAIAPANVGTLDLQTNNQLRQGAADTISLPGGANLAIRARLISVNLPENNAVTGQIAAVVSGVGFPFTFTNLGNLTVGTADGLNGITTLGGTINLSLSGANNLLTIAQPLDTTDAGSAAAGANVTLTADNMAINSGVNAGTAIVTLAPFTAGQLVNLGGNDAVGTLGLTSTELSQITAGLLRIGSVGAGNISLSSNITAPATWSTLSLITAGSVAESGLATLNVAALDVTAGTGIGTLAAPLITTVGTFAAAVGTGGTFVSNFSPTLTIGSSDGVIGVDATGAVDIETVGNLTLNDNTTTGAAAITLAAHGIGNLFTSAASVSNSAGNIITIVGDRVALDSSSTSAAGGGRIIVQPDTPNRAINLGTSTDAVLELSNSELNTLQTTGVVQIGSTTLGDSAGAIAILGAIAPAHVGTLDLETDNQVTQGAGDTITLAGGANLAIHARAAGIIAGVNLPENNVVTGQIAGIVTGLGFPFTFTNLGNLTVGTADGLNGITTFGGAIDLTLTGANNVLTIAQPLATPPGAAITLTADNMALNAAVGAVTATVTLVPFSASQVINLGGSDAGGTLGLTNAELNNITAGVLQVGNATSGNVTVSSNIALTPTNVPLLSLSTAGNITGSGSVQVSNLSLTSGAGVNLSGANAVGTLAASVSAAAQAFVFNDAGNLAVGSVNGADGVTTSGGAIGLSLTGANNLLTIAQPLDTTNAGHAAAGANVTLTADNMAVIAAVNAGTAIATLAPFTAKQLIDLGGNDAVGTLGLTSAELNQITAGTLNIGSANAGALNVSAAVAPTSPVLNLISGAAVTEAAAATISAAGALTFDAGPTLTILGTVQAVGKVTFQGDAFNKATPTVTFDGTKLSAKQAVVEGSSFGGIFNFGPSTSTPIMLKGDPGLGFQSTDFDTFNLNLNGGLQESKLNYNFSLTYSPSGFSGSYIHLADASGNVFQDISINDIEAPVPTPGFQFDPSHMMLGVAATNFAFTQSASGVSVGGDGNTETYPLASVPLVLASGMGTNPAASLITNDSFANASGQVQTATEYLVLGNGSGTLYRITATAAVPTIELGAFHSLSATLLFADTGTIVGTSASASMPGLVNRFVSDGNSSYMNTGTTAQIAALDAGNLTATANYYISGAYDVYGYSVGSADQAYHYDHGASNTVLVINGIADSYMSGTDHGQAFFNVAEGFIHTYGIATANNHDTAYFVDSPLDDVFVGFVAYSAMYHVNADNSVAEYNFAQDFTFVLAKSYVGGDDTAVIYQGANVTEIGFHLLD